MKERNSNIELLRIISMLTIISGHLLEQSGAIDVLEGGHLLYACLMSSGLRISVNIFLLIGCWFMVSSKFKPAHILRIHSQLLYYLYPLTVLVIICGFSFEIGDVVRNMFPILLRPIWFGTAYIYLLLMSPFLLILCQNTDVMGGGKILVIVLFVSSQVLCLITPKMQDNWLSDLAWFCTIYIYVYFLKHYVSVINLNKWIVLIIGLTLYCLLAYCKYELLSRGLKGSTIYIFINIWMKDLNALPNLIVSFCIFYFFIKTNMDKIKWINWFASSAFAVYIVHQAPVFRIILWNNIVCIHNWMNSIYFPILVFISIISIYVVVALIDKIRLAYAEPFMMRSLPYKFVDRLLRSWYKQFL